MAGLLKWAQHCCLHSEGMGKHNVACISSRQESEKTSSPKASAVPFGLAQTRSTRGHWEVGHVPWQMVARPAVVHRLLTSPSRLAPFPFPCSQFTAERVFFVCSFPYTFLQRVKDGGRELLTQREREKNFIAQLTAWA